jgi:hypothetical protein
LRYSQNRFGGRSFSVYPAGSTGTKGVVTFQGASAEKMYGGNGGKIDGVETVSFHPATEQYPMNAKTGSTGCYRYDPNSANVIEALGADYDGAIVLVKTQQEADYLKEFLAKHPEKNGFSGAKSQDARGEAPFNNIIPTNGQLNKPKPQSSKPKPGSVSTLEKPITQTEVATLSKLQLENQKKMQTAKIPKPQINNFLIENPKAQIIEISDGFIFTQEGQSFEISSL